MTASKVLSLTLAAAAAGALATGCGSSDSSSKTPTASAPGTPSVSVPATPATTPSDPAEPVPTDVSAASLAVLLTKIKAQTSDDVKLLTLSMTSTGGGQAQYQKNATRAAGFTWGSPGQDLTPVEVELSGDGKLSDNVFPITLVQVNKLDKILAAEKSKHGGDTEIRSAVINLNPVSFKPVWVISGASGGRTFTDQYSPAGKFVQ